MKSSSLILLALIFCLTFGSCAAYKEAVKEVSTTELRIGMSKAEAQTALKKKPDSTIAAKKAPDSDTITEVVQYRGFDSANNLTVYWLYFINDKLERWEPAHAYGPAI